jgi:putative redox protein
MTAKITYTGELRTTCTHVATGNQIITDAPLDNKGKGEFFSPTDLVATALGSCVLTIIGIYCNEHQIHFQNASIEVNKIMASNPRKIDAIELDMDFTGNFWDENTVKKVVQAGKNCPVAKTLGDNVKLEWKIKW